MFWAEIWSTNPLRITWAWEYFPWSYLKLLLSLCYWELCTHHPQSWHLCQHLHSLCCYCPNFLVKGEIFLSKIVAFEVNEVILSTVFVKRVGTLIGVYTVDLQLTNDAPQLPPCNDALMLQCKTPVCEVRIDNTERGWSECFSSRSNISL